MYNDNITDLMILKDINKNGKNYDWKGKKISNLLLADSYDRLENHKKAFRVRMCSNILEFRYYLESKELKLDKANFCKVRLCPACSSRRSLKIFGQVSKIMDYIEENHDFKYIFLTLTVRNCESEDLKDTLDLMLKAFNKMNQRKIFKQSIKGYFRSLEVTYNRETDTYHPHYHLILAVNKSYFDDKRLYVSQNDWTDLWKDCLNIDYTPIVDVRKLRKNQGKEVAEVAKYTVKPDDYLIKENGKINKEKTDKVVEILDNALHRRRLTAFGFIFKDVHKKLNLEDAENGDLVNTDNDEDLRNDLKYVILKYYWTIGIKNYKLVGIED